jgi:DNA-binding NarL/FixJ family response regulator
MPIKIVIADDHPLVIDGLQNAIKPYAEFEIMGTYCNGNSLLAALVQKQPDVLLLDIQMPGKTGSELVPVIARTYPDVKILILSGMESSTFVKSMLQQGCMGYILKNTTNQNTLIEAINRVYSGHIFVDASLKEEFLFRVLKEKRKKESTAPQLTRREKEVLQLVVGEYSNQEIADKLFLSLRTVENHRYNLLQKLNAKNTVGLVKMAIRIGFQNM